MNKQYRNRFMNPRIIPLFAAMLAAVLVTAVALPSGGTALADENNAQKRAGEASFEGAQ
jgi:hypothetical protein